MREDEAGRLFARCYGLALGLAFGAFVCTAPLAWRDVVAGACWVGQVEAGQVGGGTCAAPGSAAAEDVGAFAIAAGRTSGSAAMR